MARFEVRYSETWNVRGYRLFDTEAATLIDCPTVDYDWEYKALVDLLNELHERSSTRLGDNTTLNEGFRLG